MAAKEFTDIKYFERQRLASRDWQLDGCVPGRGLDYRDLQATNPPTEGRQLPTIRIKLQANGEAKREEIKIKFVEAQKPSAGPGWE